MMQLLCNGVFLDLYNNADLQFTHKNPLFAFDKIECERTTQFKLPSTPKNDRVFSLARIPAYTSNGMRRKFDAQLQIGSIVKNGYLYISSFDGKDYESVFVTGELLGMQQIKNAGSMRDILSYGTGVVWSDSRLKNANSNSLLRVDLVRYQTSEEHPRPSINMMRMIEDAAAKLGITIDTTNLSSLSRYRIIAGDSLSVEDMNTYFENDPVNSPVDYNTLDGIMHMTSDDGVTTQVVSVGAVNSGGNIIWDYSTAYNSRSSECGMPYFSYPVTIEFPLDFPSDYCLFKVTNRYFTPAQRNGYYGYEFFGSRGFAFDEAGGYTYFGAPLAGQKVQVPANVCFFLGKANGLVNPAPEDTSHRGLLYYDLTTLGEYLFNVKISVDNNYEYGQTIPSMAVVPDCTLIELLKTCAYLTGTILNYENGVVKFETLQTLQTQTDIGKLTKKSEVRSVFSDYAQRNIVQFSHDGVYYSEKIELAYEIDNETLESSKVVAEIPFSEGGKDDNGLLYVRGGDNVIADANLSNTNMLRVSLSLNSRIQELCTESTQFKIECRMPMIGYEQVVAKSVLNVEGTRYMWTERSWQKDVAKFTLAKLQ